LELRAFASLWWLTNLAQEEPIEGVCISEWQHMSEHPTMHASRLERDRDIGDAYHTVDDAVNTPSVVPPHVLLQDEIFPPRLDPSRSHQQLRNPDLFQ
jgi:hypothetical protein